MRLKKFIGQNSNRFLEKMGYSIRQFHPEIITRRMHSEHILNKQIQVFKKELDIAISGLFQDFDMTNLTEREIRDFMNLLPMCPVHQQGGGGGFNSAMLLWAISRLVAPKLVVESGVHKGFGTWVLRQAVPNAEIHSFDISFAQLRYCSQQVCYHEQDWNTYDLQISTEIPSLCYFDDHVSQWERLIQANQRGFRYALFDDNLPIMCLHSDGQTAFPTIDMLWDETLSDGEEINWQTECGEFSFIYYTDQAEKVRKLIKNYARLPQLHFTFGYNPANLTLIEINL